MDFNFSEEQIMLGDVVYKWAKEWLEPQMEELDEKDEFPEDFFKETGKLDLNGVVIEEEYGGAELGYTEACLVAENIARVSSALSMTWGAHVILCADNIRRHGTKEQKEKYLPGLVSGEKIGCLGITEPDAGSDAMSMRTTAVKDGDNYVINGSKSFITNAPVGHVLLFYAKTDPEKGPHGISAFVTDIDGDVPGYSCTKVKKFGMRCSPTGELAFNDMVVPAENLIGGENKGVRVLTSGLCTERIVLAACALGTMREALDLSIKYAKEREQFGRPIGRFQMIQQKLADMYSLYHASKWLVYNAAWYVDSLEDKTGGKGTELDKVAASAVLFTSEACTKVCLEGVQIHGGYGYCLEYPIQRHLRDAKLWEIGAGTSEVRRMIVARELLRD